MRGLKTLLLLLGILLLGVPVAEAHEGHDHGAPPPPVSTTVAPRMEASTSALELVAVSGQGEVTIFLDDFRSNAPLENAQIDVDAAGETLQATPVGEGVYAVKPKWAGTPGSYDLAFTVQAGDLLDILTGTLVIPSPATTAEAPQQQLLGGFAFPELVASLRQRLAAADVTLWAAVGIAFAAGFVLSLLFRRRMPVVLTFMAASLVLIGDRAEAASTLGTAPTAIRDLAQRLPDGTIFVPKQTQRVLAIRTLFSEEKVHPGTVELPARVIPDPNASGYVQSSMGGRLMAPKGGFPRLGTRVEAGQVLALVMPVIGPADLNSQQAQLREVEQEISLIETKLKRYQKLKDVVSNSAVEDAELELEGLKARKQVLATVTAEPEKLAAPVGGVIAAVNAIAGQIAEPSTVIFQIIDPQRYWVEALSYQALPISGSGEGRLSDGRVLPVSYRGTGLADRSQAVPIQFEIEGDAGMLRAGQLLTVLANTDVERKGIAVSRTAVNRQAERDLSIPDQMAQCRTWCEQRGIEVVEVFSEPGASALDEDRPVFQEMIYKAKRPDKPFDGVVVHSLSRFSRDTLHSELYIRELNKVGVDLVSITQDVGQDSTGELVRKMLHVFDEHQSRETAKHVSRAMCENARQGFWNGSTPPYGYKLEVKERRGNKDKKVLVPNETEAAVVRMIFDLASGASGRPMGVKNIAVHLNDRGIRRKGHRWSTGSVHVILSTTTYRGLHHFNKRDSRKGIPRPPSQWIAMEVPAIVDERTFDVVQGLLQSRDPKRMPPRVANGPTLLAGIARCGNCGAALIQNTGKSGAYRYYCCSKRLKEGTHDCKGLRMRMDALDGMVIGEVAKVVLEPQHLTELLEGYMRTSAERSEAAHAQLAKVRHSHKEAEAAITRLLGLVEQGIMDAGDPALRERLTGLRLQRDELARQVSEQQKRLADGTPELTPAKIKAVGSLLRDKLFEGPPELRQAYARLLLSEVAVTSSEIKITGSKSVLARCASTELDEAAPAVLSFVQKWRARQDSNP